MVKTAEWEDGKLWLDTLDYDCDQNQRSPTTLRNGCWRKPTKKQTKPQWLDTGDAFVVCLLQGLTKTGQLRALDARRALAILNHNPDKHPHAIDFIARQDIVKKRAGPPAKKPPAKKKAKKAESSSESDSSDTSEDEDSDDADESPCPLCHLFKGHSVSCPGLSHERMAIIDRLPTTVGPSASSSASPSVSPSVSPSASPRVSPTTAGPTQDGETFAPSTVSPTGMPTTVTVKLEPVDNESEVSLIAIPTQYDERGAKRVAERVSERVAERVSDDCRADVICADHGRGHELASE